MLVAFVLALVLEVSITSTTAGELTIATSIVIFLAILMSLALPFEGLITGRTIVALVIAGAIGGVVAGAEPGGVTLFTQFSWGLPFAIAAAIILAVNRLIGLGRHWLGYVVFTLLMVLEVAIALERAPWAKVPVEVRSLLLFLGPLPLINAVFDYASYAVTLTLIRWGLRANWGAAFLGLLDLGLAALLYTAAGATMILAIVSANRLAGVPLYPLAPLFAGIRADPASYLWVYLMLFATILPTVAHGVVATFSLSGLIPLPWRQTLTGWIGKGDAVPATAAPLFIGTLWLVSVLGPCLVLYGLYLLAAAFWEEPLLGYLSMFEHFARWLGELPAQP